MKNWMKTVGRGAIPAATLLLLAANGNAAFEALEVDPRARAMGGAYTAMGGGYLALFHNPAGLVVTTETNVGVSYVQPYSVDFLKMTAAGVAGKLPGKLGSVGFGFRRRATDYKDVSLDEQNTFSAAHGFTLYDDISSTVAVGYGLNLHTLEFGTTVNGEDPGSDASVGIDLGARVTLRNRTAVGFMVQNINNPTIGDVDVEELPRRVTGGVAYYPYNGVATTFDMDSVLGEKTRFRGGTEFALTEYGHLRAGIATDPNVFSGGFGVHWKGIQFDYGFSSGPGPLDESHQVGVSLTPSLLDLGSDGE
jgi:hypothetical protein